MKLVIIYCFEKLRLPTLVTVLGHEEHSEFAVHAHPTRCPTRCIVISSRKGEAVQKVGYILWF
jgi:hypothetical protein